MRKILGNIALLLLVTLNIAAKASEPKVDFSTDVLNKMTSYYLMGLDEKLYLQLDKPYYSSGDKIWLKGFLRNAITHTSLDHTNFIYVELIDSSDELVTRVKIKRDSISGFNGYMNLDPEMAAGDYTLRGYTRWMLNHGDDFIFNKALKIVSSLPESVLANQKSEKEKKREAKAAENKPIVAKAPIDYTVQFFPEGGALLGGTTQIVAFKAVAADGLSLEITGAIYNSNDEEVCQISSQHKGMGMTVIACDKTQSYYAKTVSGNGLEKRFELPTVEQEGAAISARKSGNRLLFQVNTPTPSLTRGANIVVHSHGRLVSVTELSSSALNAISYDGLFDGINVISLVSKEGQVISERLFFKRPSSLPEVVISSSSSNFSRREKARVKLNIKDSFGQGAQGEFGVSITDNSSVSFDSGDDNILSNLLLTSDLRGYVEAPGSYFEGETAIADRHVDLLMRTQGWRRFALQDILSEQFKQPMLKYEAEAEISGNVKGFFGNDARKPELIVTCPSLNFVDNFTLDESSRFKLLGVNIPDSATYVIQARTRKGGNTLTLNIDPEPFPTPKSTILPRSENFYIPLAFVNQSQEKFYYEGGMDLVTLDAVYVTASTNDETSSSFSTHSTGRAQLESMSSLPLSMLLQQYPGISISSGSEDEDEEINVYHRGSGTPARFYIDGMYMEYSDVSHLTAMDLEKIEFFSGADAAMYSDAAGGIFVIEMRQGSYATPHITAPGIAFVSNLGYQEKAEFYQPDYNAPAKRNDATPDFRTTIFWDGAIIPDANGDVELEFYTADKPTTYTLTLEGVTTEGEIVRATSQLNRTK